MGTKRHRTGGLQLAVTGFIVFNELGDDWLAAHSKERLEKFMAQQPWLKLEPEIHPISSRLDEIRIIKPDSLKDRHAEALAAIPSPDAKRQKAKRTLPHSAMGRNN